MHFAVIPFLLSVLGVFLYGFKGREVLTPELRAGSLYPKSKIRITRWCMVQAALLFIGVLALIEGKFDQNFGRVVLGVSRRKA